jgi:hypothetical protein
MKNYNSGLAPITLGLLKLVTTTVLGTVIVLAAFALDLNRGGQERRDFAEQMNDDEHHPNRTPSTNKVYFFASGAIGDRVFSWTTANTESCDASFEFTLRRPKFLTILRNQGFVSISCNGIIQSIPEQSEIDQMPTPLERHKNPATPHRKTNNEGVIRNA